jgi:hypothetical protein
MASAHCTPATARTSGPAVWRPGRAMLAGRLPTGLPHFCSGSNPRNGWLMADIAVWTLVGRSPSNKIAYVCDCPRNDRLLVDEASATSHRYAVNSPALLDLRRWGRVKRISRTTPEAKVCLVDGCAAICLSDIGEVTVSSLALREAQRALDPLTLDHGGRTRPLRT